MTLLSWQELPDRAGFFSDAGPGGGCILLLRKSYDGDVWTVRWTYMYEKAGVLITTSHDYEDELGDEEEYTNEDNFVRSIKETLERKFSKGLEPK